MRGLGERLALKVQKASQIGQGGFDVVEKDAGALVGGKGLDEFEGILLLHGQRELNHRQRKPLLEHKDGGFAVGDAAVEREGKHAAVRLADEQRQHFGFFDQGELFRPLVGFHRSRGFWQKRFDKRMDIVPDARVPVFQRTQVVQQGPMRLVILDILRLVDLSKQVELL